MKKITTIKISVIVFLILSLSSSLSVFAQFDAMFTQYVNNEMFINPAYTGSKEGLCVTALHRQQWVSFEGRPVTTTLTMHSPIGNNNMGLGLSLLDERIGVTKRNIIYLSYAYKIQLNTKSHLAFGIMGGVHIQSDNYADVLTDQNNDPWFSQNVHNRTSPNFGFGVNYYTDKFFAGIAIPRLLDDKIGYNDLGKPFTNLNLEPASFHYFLTIGRVCTVNDNFLIRPTVMVKAVKYAPIEFDINVSTLINQHLWLGASYRSKADICANLGLQLGPRYLISYSYDYTSSALNKVTTGSHEIVLSALIGYKGKKISSNRYF